MACKFQEEISRIIGDGDSRTLVETAKLIAGEMVVKRGRSVDDRSSVTTSQIRNIYGSAKKIDMNLDENNAAEQYNRLLLLQPKMAYANGRHNKRGQIRGFTLLVDCLSNAIQQVDSDYKRMKNFFNFFEAILAYHKAEGGK